jgi:hypothetical protein
LAGFVIQDAGWAGGQHLMVRPLSNDLRERVVQGVFSDFARTGGATLANVIMEDFAKNLAAELSGAGSGDQTSAISAHKVVWRAIKAKLT